MLRNGASGEWKADTAVDRTAEEMNAEVICMMYCYDEQTGAERKRERSDDGRHVMRDMIRSWRYCTGDGVVMGFFHAYYRHHFEARGDI